MAAHECTHDQPGSGGLAFRPADDKFETAADQAADAALSARPATAATHPRKIPSSSGSGRSLSPAESAYFEPRFGFDFSSVRIHADPTASARAESIGASAYTRGSSITFARPPETHSAAGRRLFAHELAHVVQQSRSPSLAGAVQRQPTTDKPGIVRVVIYHKARRIKVTLSDDTIMTLIMNPKTSLDPGEYRGKHTQGSRANDAVMTKEGKPLARDKDWFFNHPTAKPVHNWPDLATSEYDIVVFDKRRPGTREEEKEMPSAEGKKAESTTGGAKGTGKGTGTGGGTGAGSGTKTGGQKGGGGGTTKGDKPPEFPAETDAEKKAKVDAVLKELENLPNMKGGKPFTQEQLDKFAEMTAAELADVLKYLKETAAEADDAIDPSAELDKYLKMSPSDRELLRINQRLIAGGETGPLPERVTIALTASAEKNEQLVKGTKEINEQLHNLSKIHAQVTHDTLLDQENANLDPIDLEKLPVFREMMMLEGLLAGASTKSPQIEESAKELTKSIAGIRDYVLEEILWLAAEIAASMLIGFLTGPIGATAAVARGATLIYRLNNLRKFLQKVEEVYSTFRLIEKIIGKVSTAYSAYKSFESNFGSSLAELEKLREALDDPNLDDVAAAAAADKVAELEDAIVEKMLTQLETNTGVGALLEYFDIPADADEDDLREILFNIPAGLQELNALVARYRVSGRDLEAVKLLAYKSVLVGVLLYPFVGFLAREIGGRLSNLMAEKDISDRLIDVVGRAGSKKEYKSPGAGAARKRLGEAKRKPKAKPVEAKKKPPPKKKGKAEADPTKDPAKVDDPNAKKGAPTSDDAGKPKVKEKPLEAQDPSKKPEADDPTQAKKKPDVADVDDPAKKPKDPKDPKDPDDPTKKKDPDDPSKKKDDKAKPPDPADAEWVQVKQKVSQLPASNQPDGATRSALRSQGNKIKKKHPKVAKGVSVQPVPNRGEWRIAISRKGVLKDPAAANVLMGYRERWEAGQNAIRAAVAKLDAQQRTKATIEQTIAAFQTAYGYAALDVVNHTTEDRSGFTVVGRMGNAKRRDIADIDDLTGLHTGESGDPIPLSWYKHLSWYPGYAKPLKLKFDGTPVDFKMTDAPRTVTLDSGEKVQIGVDQANIVDVGSKLRRSTRKSQRAKATRDNFEAALKKVGFHDWIDKDIDHVTDLAFEGKDRYPNLWPLNWEKNRHAFYGKWYAHHKIQYLDKKDPLKLKTGTLFDGLAGKHFTIERIAAAVPGYGGRSAKKP